jgi:hypothetical protein
MTNVANISERILVVRGQRAILDSDLALLYGVETRVLVQAVKRNPGRFPRDFCFRLENQDVAALRSQIVMSKPEGRGGRRSIPLVFTEHGAIMAATVLNSAVAIELSVHVVRAFVQMRQAALVHREIARRVDELERKVGTHDHAIVEILGAIRSLAAPPKGPKRKRIGFV